MPYSRYKLVLSFLKTHSWPTEFLFFIEDITWWFSTASMGFATKDMTVLLGSSIIFLSFPLERLTFPKNLINLSTSVSWFFRVSPQKLLNVLKHVFVSLLIDVLLSKYVFFNFRISFVTIFLTFGKFSFFQSNVDLCNRVVLHLVFSINFLIAVGNPRIWFVIFIMINSLKWC